ncbi:hypothetical protein T07_12054 [Trichinella nelsoni]|uniref:Uncharacterized protein n=1 Tax=Trichinella nelsoni TaxID=6336 RepID=A0A0V0S9Q6_9BILA|nr:hypothetical protein T07_12054 [Trichinella nelsoni]
MNSYSPDAILTLFSAYRKAHVDRQLSAVCQKSDSCPTLTSAIWATINHQRPDVGSLSNKRQPL